MTTFTYFDQPEVFTGLTETAIFCDICGTSTLCFDARSFYGTKSLTAVCPECLAGGALRDIDAYTCEGDSTELRRQITALHPELTASEIDHIVREKTTLLEKTTPCLINWQDWQWPCADGDYCRFIGYGSRTLYKELAKGKPAKAFFEESFYDPDSYDEAQWTEDLPGKAILSYDDSSQYSTLFYVFRSLHSDRIVTIWDCE